MAAPQKRLRGKTRVDLLARYRSRVDNAMKWREQEGYDKLWRRCVELYRGKHFPQSKLKEKADRIAVNVTFSTINVIVPSIAINDPKLIVLAQKNEEAVNAIIIETVLNYWWRSYDFQPELALATKDYLVIGHGWLKVGWRYVEEVKDREREAQAAAGPDADDATLTPEDKTDKPNEDISDPDVDTDPEYEVTADRPFVERVSPHDVIVDPDATTLASAKWIAQKTVVPLARLRQDERYRLKGRQAAIPDCHERGQQDGKQKQNDDVDRVTVWEFYDMELGTMCVFPHNGDELLLDPIKQPYSFGHPFIMLRNYEVPDQFYPMGDVEALEPLQQELNKTRTQMMNHRARYDRKWIFRKDAFDAQGIAMLRKDQDNVMVPTVDQDAPLQDLIAPIPITSVDQALYQYSEGLMQDFDKVSGVSEFQQGQSPDIRHTATEAAMISDAANSRAADKLRQIEKCMAKVAERVLCLGQQYMTQDQEARILGQNGHPVWIPYGRSHLQGCYDFNVEAGSTKPLNESQRRNSAIQLLQTMIPFAQAGLVNTKELLRYALVMGFGVKEPDKFLMGAAPPPSGEQHKTPRQSIIETLNYKDAPPDIQRQMEQEAGFEPSQTGGSSPAEGLMAKAMGPHIQAAAQGPQQAQQGQQQALLEAAKQQASASQQHVQHAHEASMAHEDRRHDHATAQRDHQHRVVEGAVGHAQAIQQGEAQHGQAMEQQGQQGDQQMMQQMMGQAMQPEEPESTATGE